MIEGLFGLPGIGAEDGINAAISVSLRMRAPETEISPLGNRIMIFGAFIMAFVVTGASAGLAGARPSAAAGPVRSGLE